MTYLLIVQFLFQIKKHNKKDTMIPHDIPSNSREKVGCDIFNGSHFLLCVDYYSKYLEIAKLDCMKAKSTIKYLKSMFSQHGI